MGSIRRYMQFVRPYNKIIAVTVTIGIFKFGLPLLTPLILAYIIDHVLLADGMATAEKARVLAWLAGGAVVLFIIVRPPIEYYRQYFAQWTGNKILYDIRDQLFSHIQKLSLRFYSNRKAGEIISRVINDVELTKDFVITGLMNIWLDLATIIIVLIIMFTMDVELTLVAMLFLPIYAFFIKYFYSRLRDLTKARSQALANVQGHLHERVQGMSVIRSFALENHEQGEFDTRNRQFLDRAVDHTRWNAKTFAAVNTVTDVAPLVVILAAGLAVLYGNLSVGEMVAFTSYMERLYSPLRRLVNSSTTLVQSIASMDRVFEFIDEKYDITDKETAVPVKHVKGDIKFDHVWFKYEEDTNDVLKDVDLHVRPGETIALVGMSGGGKSTIVSLLPRFYDVTGGALLLDGKDVRDYEVRTLRDHIGMVLQDNILFSESVKENIRMGKPDATDEEVIQAARMANAEVFINELPLAYNTPVGERGVKLSGGQKQRIAIARVFLKNPSILVFDEATSALDLESEHYIQEAMERLARDRTTFIVAHRLSTITHADRIVVIEDGRVVESGSHEQLMMAEGSYQRLFDVQHV